MLCSRNQRICLISNSSKYGFSSAAEFHDSRASLPNLPFVLFKSYFCFLLSPQLLGSLLCLRFFLFLYSMDFSLSLFSCFRRSSSQAGQNAFSGVSFSPELLAHCSLRDTVATREGRVPLAFACSSIRWMLRKELQ